MEVTGFSNKRSQTAGTVVRDKKGELWKVSQDIPYVGFKLNQPFESEFYSKVTPVDIEKLAIELNESMSDLKKQISALELRIKSLEPENDIALNDKDFYIEDLNGVKTIRKR